MLHGMVTEGLVIPVIREKDGRPYTNISHGLTAKGWGRLYELEHPIRCWMGRQWFPLVVALVASAVSIANIVITFLMKGSTQ